MTKYIGILTAGGDTPGLNAAIRGLGKAAQHTYGMEVIGFRDGFRGLMENRTVRLDGETLSGILTMGGTILGTSRDKPHKMPIGNKTLDMTDVMLTNYRKHHLDALICLGGNGTQSNALKLMEKGMNIITLPKTIDNDVAETDMTFGFDTAVGIATEAIDRLHSTAHSHHRIIVVEVMGHSAGWLALSAGVAGGADVILIPELPYNLQQVAEAILDRRRKGKHFSIVAVAEGAMSQEEAAVLRPLQAALSQTHGKAERQHIKNQLADWEKQHKGHVLRLAQQLEALTRLEARVTILGHVQRGGTPSAVDRILATQLGTACAELVHRGQFGVMVAIHGQQSVPVPLPLVAGKLKLVPTDHPLLESARRLGTAMGE
ncbi:MAG: ATP-dependent 6-phosphofructokinase [Chloroflexi bacterium]|nr:ATP-dependent 6-phosphofructokinase [Chloroflexota bacterium]